MNVILLRSCSSLDETDVVFNTWIIRVTIVKGFHMLLSPWMSSDVENSGLNVAYSLLQNLSTGLMSYLLRPFSYY
jgi:hypothetical protein